MNKAEVLAHHPIGVAAPDFAEEFPFVVTSRAYGRHAGFGNDQTAHEFAKIASDQFGSTEFYVWQDRRPIARYVAGRKVGG